MALYRDMDHVALDAYSDLAAILLVEPGVVGVRAASGASVRHLAFADQDQFTVRDELARPQSRFYAALAAIEDQ
jgi:hypothetical protein